MPKKYIATCAYAWAKEYYLLSTVRYLVVSSFYNCLELDQEPENIENVKMQSFGHIVAEWDCHFSRHKTSVFQNSSLVDPVIYAH